MVAGDCKNTTTAAEKVGLARESLSRALSKPHVAEHLRQKVIRSLAISSARAGAVKQELLECDNAMVRDRASTVVLGLSGIQPATTSKPHITEHLRRKIQRSLAVGATWVRQSSRNSRRYLILAKHSFRRSSSERTWVSMASCNASVPLLANSAEAFLSRFCFQSRIACLVALWASDVALRYAFMQASAIEQVLHS